MTRHDIWDLNTAYNCPNSPPKPSCNPAFPSLPPRTELGSDSPCIVIHSAEYPRPMTGAFENYWDFMVCDEIKKLELNQLSVDYQLLYHRG